MPFHPNCENAHCTVPECSNGILIAPLGQCCQRCVPLATINEMLCDLITCDEPQCLPHQRLFTADGACCPECRDDCSLVACEDPLCDPTHESYTPDGKCCKTCRELEAQNTAAVHDCSGVLCNEPLCKPYQRISVVDGDCCPTCHDITTLLEVQDTDDCSKVVCDVPICEPDQDYFTPEGECCPVCRQIIRQDCTGVRCPHTPCEQGQSIFFPEGECCPRCMDFPVDCRGKRCSLPVCSPGMELFTPTYQCCPICRDIQPDCTDVTCFTPRCSQDQVFLPEGFCCQQCHNTFVEIFCRWTVPSSCTIPPCGSGQPSALLRECCNHGSCCPDLCRQTPTETCAAITCYPPRSLRGTPSQDTFTPEGECCPRSRDVAIDCRVVHCSLPKCGTGQELSTTADQCCPTCHDIPLTRPPNCADTVCPEVWCSQGEERYCPQDECCCRCR